MKRVTIKISVLTLLLFFSSLSSLAQGWVHHTGYHLEEVIQLPNGNYLVSGGDDDQPPGNAKVYVRCIDPYGKMVWEKKYGSGNYSIGYSLAATYDGGFAIAAKISNFNNDTSLYLTKFDINGDSIWTKPIYDAHGPGHGIPYDIIQNPDSGFTICGTLDNIWPDGHAFCTRTDKDGNALWIKTDSLLPATSVCRTYDGGFAYVIVSNIGIIPTVNDTAITVIKRDANGLLLWQKRYLGVRAVQYLADIMENSDSTLTVAGMFSFPFDDIGFLRLSAQGDTLLSKIYYPSSGALRQKPYMIRPTLDGGYIAYGISHDQAWTKQNIFLKKFDAGYGVEWDVHFPKPPNFNPATIIQTPDSGYVLSGNTTCCNGGSYVIRTDKYGKAAISKIQGTVYHDLNDNCTLDSNESGWRNIIVSLTKANSTYYALTDDTGHYEVLTYSDSTLYSINLPHLSPMWGIDSCILPLLDTAIAGGVDTFDFHIPVTPRYFCPDLSVTIANPGFRRCFNGFLSVNYCNNGTIDASNAYIELASDADVTFVGSTLPWATPQSGNIYRFDVGSIPYGQCGNFTITTYIDCAAQLGAAACVSAHIYPDSVCIPADPLWDRSYIKVTGSCDLQDSVRFEIKNTGSGDMLQPQQYYIVEDNVMFRNDNYQLLAGGTKNVSLKANGSTWTLIANQSSGYPGKNFPLYSVEGCGVNTSGGFSTGFLLQFPQNDQDDFIDINCGEFTDSFDPNDKQVSPEGFTSIGYISEDQPLDYRIRFQNTGTDTAFTVVVRDTLSDNLDITTLQLGASDHNYTFAIHGSNVLEWTFNNILLPDSNVNEPASHGFLTFSINQKANNQPGDVILNQAGIYFDFNAPVITNTTINTIVEDYKQWLAVEEVSDKDNSIQIYPNPTEGQLTVVLEGKPTDTFRMGVYDLAGKQVKEYQLQGAGAHTINDMKLRQGMYLYRVFNNNTAAGSGKLIILKTY